MARRLFRRVTSMLGKMALAIWDVTPPSAVSGTGAETKYSGYMAIPDPKPADEHLFAVPNVKLETDGGGNLVSTVEFWDETELLSSATMETLGVYDPPINFADYRIPDIDSFQVPELSGTGRTSSDWVNLSTAIPAGSGFLTAGYAGCSTAIVDAGLPDFSIALSCSLELENVGEIPLLSFSQTFGSFGSTQSATTTPSAANFPFSCASPITKARLHVDVSSCVNCKASGYIGYMNGRMVY